MKKFYSTIMLAIMFIASTLSVNAQMISKVNLQKYARQQYGAKWEKAADDALAKTAFDNRGNMTLTKEISAPMLTKNELYIEMANWFISNYDNSIQFADKEEGIIIARPFIENIATHSAGFNAYNVSINPTVRVKVEDGKLIVNYSLSDYYVVEEAGGGATATGILAGLAAAAITGAIIDEATTPSRPAPHHTTVVDHFDRGFGHSRTVIHEYHPHHSLEDALLVSCIAGSAASTPSKDYQTWSLSQCYPFVQKDGHKKTSSKAFVMSNIYSQVVMNTIEEAVNQCELAYNK